MNVGGEGYGVAVVVGELTEEGSVTVTVGSIGVATMGACVALVTEDGESPQPDRRNTNEKNRMKCVFIDTMPNSLR